LSRKMVEGCEELLTYLIIINSITFFIMAIDKRKAINKKWRIPERRIWLIAIIGGAFGATIAYDKLRICT
ncbi:DUF1294 domain-containing protein, partial [Gracilibacillus boraciitolerans]|uniref:DUF1294 domain-containing protein n=1 Tax=Gracilibacillus boraciitolerans TaxID=307521 RepID=UPI001F378639